MMGRDHSCEECGGSGLSGLPHEPWCSDSHRERYREALEAIRDTDPVDAALDPDRARRIAKEALLPTADEVRGILKTEPVPDERPWEDEDPRHYAHRMGDPNV